MSETFRIRHVRKTGGHPIEGLVRRALDEQYERGFRNPETDVASTCWDHEAVWVGLLPNAEAALRPVAVMQFRRMDWNRSIETAWSYTLPTYRRRGFNRALFDAVAEIARRDGYHTILRGTHPDNVEMVEAMRAAGGQLQRLTFKFTIETHTGSINDRFEFP